MEAESTRLAAQINAGGEAGDAADEGDRGADEDKLCSLIDSWREAILGDGWQQLGGGRKENDEEKKGTRWDKPRQEEKNSGKRSVFDPPESTPVSLSFPPFWSGLLFKPSFAALFRSSSSLDSASIFWRELALVAFSRVTRLHRGSEPL